MINRLFIAAVNKHSHLSAAFTYTKPVYCCQSVVWVQEDGRFMGYWKRYDDKLNNKYGLFQEYILQFQTLNITVKLCYSVKELPPVSFVLFSKNCERQPQNGVASTIRLE